MDYKISKQAEIDLENIWLYTFEEWSLEQADYYFDLIMDEFRKNQNSRVNPIIKVFIFLNARILKGQNSI